MKYSGWVIGLAVVVGCASAEAATLTPVAGEVLVNQGNGYKPAGGPVEVNPGDSILVNPGGSAQLAYGDCATYEIKPGDVVYVADASAVPCAGAGAGGGAAAALGGVGASTLVVGGLAVAVGVGVVAGVSSGSDSPASP